MIRSRGYIITYLVLLCAQIVAGNFCNFTSLIVLSVLPSLILFLPTSCSSISAMLIAFVTGFVADFFTDGALCLSVVALLPVALTRKEFISLFIGNDIVPRRENISLKRHGWLKVFLASLSLNALYLLIYIPVDAMGTAPFWYLALQIFVSLVVNTLISLPVCGLFSNSYEIKAWR